MTTNYRALADLSTSTYFNKFSPVLLIRETIGYSVEKLINFIHSVLLDARFRVSFAWNQKKTELKNRIFYAKI